MRRSISANDLIRIVHRSSCNMSVRSENSAFSVITNNKELEDNEVKVKINNPDNINSEDHSEHHSGHHTPEHLSGHHTPEDDPVSDDYFTYIDEFHWTNEAYHELNTLGKRLKRNPVGKHLYKYLVDVSIAVYNLHDCVHPYGWIHPGEKYCYRKKNNTVMNTLLTLNPAQRLSLAFDYLFKYHGTTKVVLERTTGVVAEQTSRPKDDIILPQDIYDKIGNIICTWVDSSIQQYSKPRTCEFIEYKLSYLINKISQHLGFNTDVISMCINITLLLSYMHRNNMISYFDEHDKLYSRCLDVDISFLSSMDRSIFNDYFGANRCIYIRFLLVSCSYMNKHYVEEESSDSGSDLDSDSNSDSPKYTFLEKFQNLDLTKLMKLFDNYVLGHVIMMVVLTTDGSKFEGT